VLAVQNDNPVVCIEIEYTNLSLDTISLFNIDKIYYADDYRFFIATVDTFHLYIWIPSIRFYLTSSDSRLSWGLLPYQKSVLNADSDYENKSTDWIKEWHTSHEIPILHNDYSKDLGRIRLIEGRIEVLPQQSVRNKYHIDLSEFSAFKPGKYKIQIVYSINGDFIRNMIGENFISDNSWVIKEGTFYCDPIPIIIK
jgi:hypothetical protein